ncbi:hypothetical protein PTSG_02141 [Salpingoeca rosetta]|uniref:Anaphase-promoting complex subunit 4 n=1 Tax=Salpingoeca rosetta (strain ATCC 50818 / BSB-021) TaxID=946362 RepID=F2U1B9_SALR5|nr:uncharacterized protein PTSG_02141 [Salpingoeca rosetta]EGD81421.1 hypothetical protein PTSG_02141 [Salpingoeca rosetta]|eukprot:XP_004996625.1 hypothetical protein PTSG_02141 [Salpingoeca rosetta]
MTRVDAAWVEADEDGLPRSETFSVSERRLGPNGTAVMSWCPRMDLLAIGTAAGRVCLYRHIWQRVWTVPPVEDGVAVTHLHWREDGKVLLVAYGNQTARLYDVEKPTLLHTLSLDGNVTCCDWRTHQINVRDENGSRNSSGRTQQDEPPLRMLKPDRAPLTLRRFAPKFEVPSTVEGEEFVDDTDPAAATDSTFNLLAVGTDAGVVLLFGCGFVLLGHFNCSETDRGNIRGLSLSFESASLAITHDGADNNIVTQQVSLEGVCSNVEEMLSFCVVQRSCSATIKYLECTLECMKATWHSFLLDLDDRFSAFLRDTAPGVKLHDELLVLLVTGTTQSLELQAFLTRELGRRSLQNMVTELRDSFISLEEGCTEEALWQVVKGTVETPAPSKFDVAAALMLLEDEGAVVCDEGTGMYKLNCPAGDANLKEVERVVGTLGRHVLEQSLVDCLPPLQTGLQDVLTEKQTQVNAHLQTLSSHPLGSSTEVHRVLLLSATQHDVVVLEQSGSDDLRAARLQFGDDIAVLAAQLYDDDQVAAVIQLRQQDLVFCLFEYAEHLEAITADDLQGLDSLDIASLDDVSFRRLTTLPSPSVSLAVGAGRQLGAVCSSREHFVVLDLGADDEDDDDDEEEDEEGDESESDE